MSQRKIEELSNLPDHQFVAFIEEFNLELRRLHLENTVFENFLVTHEPSMVARLEQTLEKVQSMQVKIEELTVRPLRTSSQMSGLSTIERDSQIVRFTSSIETAGVVRISRGPRINLSQKIDLISRAMDEMHLKLAEFIRNAHHTKNRLIAEIEESDIRDKELKESMDNFEQIVVVGGLEAITQKIPAEIFVRYMLEWLKFSQTMLEKLRLRTSSLRTQERKLKQLLSQKEEVGESVHEVDFETLYIDNKNLQLCVDQKNRHLKDLKRMNGQANLLLATHKSFLQKQQEVMDEVMNRITTTIIETDTLEEELNETSKTLDKFQSNYDKMKKIVRKYVVPDVMEYITKKAELAELKKTLKVWLRKRNIQTVAIGTYTKMMCQLTGAHKPKASWFQSPMSTPDSLSPAQSKTFSLSNRSF